MAELGVFNISIDQNVNFSEIKQITDAVLPNPSSQIEFHSQISLTTILQHCRTLKCMVEPVGSSFRLSLPIYNQPTSNQFLDLAYALILISGEQGLTKSHFYTLMMGAIEKLSQ